MKPFCHKCGAQQLTDVTERAIRADTTADRILRLLDQQTTVFAGFLERLTRLSELHSQSLHHHTELLERIMSDQSHLDADVAAISTSLAAIEAEIAALKSVPTSPPLDFSGLDAAVAKMGSDVPAADASAPADAAPADAAPVDVAPAEAPADVPADVPPAE